MFRLLHICLSLILTCYIIHSFAKAQTVVENKDSLRSEIQNLLNKSEELIDISNKSTIDSAQVILDSLVIIVEEKFLSNDTLLAKTYKSLARSRHASSEYDLAAEFALKAIDVLDRTPGENHVLTLSVLEMLVEGCLQKHDLICCEDYSNKRFAILDNLTKPLTVAEAEQMADALNDKSRLLVLQNRYEEAIGKLEYALSFVTNQTEKGARLRVDLNGNIAWILAQQGLTAESKNRLLEVLEMAKRAYHPKHPLVLYTIHLLGMSARQQGDYSRADSIMDVELALSEEIHGKFHPMQSDIFQAKSHLLLIQDLDEQANEFAQRAVSVNKKYTGDYPTNKLMGSLENAGNVALATDSWELASEIFAELLSHRHSFLNTVFGYASEAQKLNYLNKYPPIINTLINGAINHSSDALCRTAMDMVLRGKGMAIDAIAAEQEAALCSLDPYMESLLDKRKVVCSEIAQITLSAQKNKESVRQKLDALYAKKDDIETDLSQSCSRLQLGYDADGITTAKITSRIPDGSVLWEFVKYARVDLDKLYEGLQSSRESYVAITLTPDARLTIVDLGEASIIDSLVRVYRDFMSESLSQILINEGPSPNQEYEDISVQLYNRLIRPLEGSMDNVSKVYIAGDGGLNLLPFETITNDGERYLIEDYQFIYLTSGRDLLKEKTDKNGRNAFVVADPDYMIDPSAQSVLAYAEIPEISNFRGNTDPPECLSSMFSPLPMTRQEGNMVARILGDAGGYQVSFLESADAREETLKNLNSSPAVLHIATHGYFCQRSENIHMSNPLLRSGLILAGANHTIGGVSDNPFRIEDGILTALEASGLNLIGTDLVVLSACQTGIGDVQNGEGVFGLRRAFQHAGAKSIVMSMFAVPDESTSDLMERFYTNWLSGQSKSAAMRNASLSILNERRQDSRSTHPLFWGGFILVGDPD